MRRLISAVTVMLDGALTRSETRCTAACAHVVTYSTCLPDRGWEIHSTYHGAPAASLHLILFPGQPPRTVVAEHDAAALPVWHARRACLRDRLQRVQDALQTRWAIVAIDCGDLALVEA